MQILFMTSQIQTAKHKIAAIAYVFLPLSIVDFNTKQIMKYCTAVSDSAVSE